MFILISEKILRCLPIPGHIFRYFQICFTKIRKNFDTTKILTIFVIQNIILQNRPFTYNLLKFPYKVSEYNLVTKGDQYELPGGGHKKRKYYENINIISIIVNNSNGIVWTDQGI